jgi:hypothetical protein
MNRRRFIQSTVGIFLFSGCGQPIYRQTPRTLNINIQSISNKNETWIFLLELDIAPLGVQIPNINLVTYTFDGEKLCDDYIGTLSGGRSEARFRCSKFPEIITAKTSLDCDKTQTEIIYWVGTEDEKTEYGTEIQERRGYPTDNSQINIRWKSTRRRCDEKLPPERLVNGTIETRIS